MLICGSRECVPRDGYGKYVEMCRTLAQLGWDEPDPNTLRAQVLRHGPSFPSESLGCVPRDKGLYSTAVYGPHWSDVRTLAAWYENVIGAEIDGRWDRANALHRPKYDTSSPAPLVQPVTVTLK